MSTMPWFRFYSEAMHDTKLRRIARKTGVSFAETFGTWAAILSFASESPQRGKLLLSDGNPVDKDDIEDVTGCNVSETLQQLQSNGMLSVTDGVLTICNWSKRQYESDNSTPRVQKHRAQKAVAGTTEKRYSNVSETPPETETETETEAETEAETEDHEDGGSRRDPAFGLAIRSFENDIGLVSGSILPDMQDVWDTLTANGTPGWWQQALEVAVGANKRSWRYVRGILIRCVNEGHPPSQNGAQPKTQTSGTARIKVVIDGVEEIREIVTHG